MLAAAPDLYQMEMEITYKRHLPNPAWLVDVGRKRLYVLTSPTYVQLDSNVDTTPTPEFAQRHLHISAEGPRWYVTAHACRITTMNTERDTRIPLEDGQGFQTAGHRFVFRCILLQ
jgi:hypothetical protein